MRHDRFESAPRNGGWVDRHIHRYADDGRQIGRVGATVMHGWTARRWPTAETWVACFTRSDPAFFDAWREDYVDVPHVSYVRVHAAFRRRGHAVGLYLEMARWLAEYGLPLVASDQRNERTLALWEKMLVDPAVPTFVRPDGRPGICLVTRGCPGSSRRPDTAAR